VQGSIGVAVVGAGAMGRLHASLVSRDARVTIRGFADVSEEKARTAAQMYGGESFVDYRSLIDSSHVDAVFVTLPNALHAEPALYATAAGKHVFSEKPMATTVDEAVRIRDAIGKEMLVYWVGFNKRFAPVYRELRRTIYERGTPTMALAKMNRGELEDPLWVGDPSLTGGYLYETPIHVIDICRHVLDDEVAEVRCLGTAAVYKEERLDNLTAQLTFSRGTLVTLFSCAHATWAFPWERLEFFGDHWMAETEEFDRFRYSASLQDATITRDFSLLPREDRWGYAAQDRAFVDAIVGEEFLGAYAENGLEAVRIVAACYESAPTGRPITLDGGQRRTR
jgi:myo-inositol 2-dehydrogenase / D-chiro-inositol 1-dehydrogenase